MTGMSGQVRVRLAAKNARAAPSPGDLCRAQTNFSHGEQKATACTDGAHAYHIRISLTLSIPKSAPPCLHCLPGLHAAQQAGMAACVAIWSTREGLARLRRPQSLHNARTTLDAGRSTSDDGGDGGATSDATCPLLNVRTRARTAQSGPAMRARRPSRPSSKDSRAGDARRIGRGRRVGVRAWTPLGSVPFTSAYVVRCPCARRIESPGSECVCVHVCKG